MEFQIAGNSNRPTVPLQADLSHLLTIIASNITDLGQHTNAGYRASQVMKLPRAEQLWATH